MVVVQPEALERIAVGTLVAALKVRVAHLARSPALELFRL